VEEKNKELNAVMANRVSEGKEKDQLIIEKD